MARHRDPTQVRVKLLNEIGLPVQVNIWGGEELVKAAGNPVTLTE
jgi:hypothetical protein